MYEKVRRSESQKKSSEGGGGREEGGGKLHFAFLPEHSDTYLIQTPIQSEHFSPTKATCEVKLFTDLHKKHFLDQINGFCCDLRGGGAGWGGGVTVSQTQRVEASMSNH